MRLSALLAAAAALVTSLAAANPLDPAWNLVRYRLQGEGFNNPLDAALADEEDQRKTQTTTSQEWMSRAPQAAGATRDRWSVQDQSFSESYDTLEATSSDFAIQIPTAQPDDSPQPTTEYAYDRMRWYASFAAASYCDSVLNLTSPEVHCQKGMCPNIDGVRILGAHRAPYRDLLTTLVSAYDQSYLIMEDPRYKTVVVAFEGSDFLRKGDVTRLSRTFTQKPFKVQNCTDCKVSANFYETWLGKRAEIVKIIQAAGNPHVVVVGHSAGAAIATIATADLRADPALAKFQFDMYAYASPRIGNAQFATFLTKQAEPNGRGENYRLTHYHDTTPRSVGGKRGGDWDPSSPKWRHPGPEYFISIPGDTIGPKDVQYFPPQYVNGFVTESLNGNGGPKGRAPRSEVLNPAILLDYHRHYLIHVSGPYC